MLMEAILPAQIVAFESIRTFLFPSTHHYDNARLIPANVHSEPLICLLARCSALIALHCFNSHFNLAAKASRELLMIESRMFRTGSDP